MLTVAVVARPQSETDRPGRPRQPGDPSETTKIPPGNDQDTTRRPQLPCPGHKATRLPPNTDGIQEHDQDAARHRRDSAGSADCFPSSTGGIQEDSGAWSKYSPRSNGVSEGQDHFRPRMGAIQSFGSQKIAHVMDFTMDRIPADTVQAIGRKRKLCTAPQQKQCPGTPRGHTTPFLLP